MSERDEIMESITTSADELGITASGAFEALIALFAEKPWLADELLPDGYRVFKCEKDLFGTGYRHSVANAPIGREVAP
jgi:hypothetical protein